MKDASSGTSSSSIASMFNSSASISLRSLSAPSSNACSCACSLPSSSDWPGSAGSSISSSPGSVVVSSLGSSSRKSSAERNCRTCSANCVWSLSALRRESRVACRRGSTKGRHRLAMVRAEIGGASPVNASLTSSPSASGS